MLSFYLDYYPGYRDKETMKVIRHETLGIYLYADPKNKREQNFNEVMTEKAEAIRCRRFESVVNERYDFFDKYKLKADFLEYFRSQLRKHDPKWEFVYLHFRNFVHDKYTIDLIVQLANEVGLFKEKLDADDVAARYATDTLRTMTSRNNTRLVVLLDKLASSGIIPYHWQAVIAKKKLVVSSSGRKYLDQHDMSSTLNRSKETPPSISEKHFLAIIDKYIRKIKSKEV